MKQPITLLILDDHPLVRWGIRTFVSTQPDISLVGEAESGEEALLIAEEQAPDVALVDLIMPGMGGIEVTRKLKQLSPRTQVIVLTSYHDDKHIFPAIKAGALSYLLKDVMTDTLADAIRKAASGEAVIHPQVATRLIKDIQSAHPQQDHTPVLSEREKEVLRLIAEGCNNTTIAEHLIISENTVKSHVSNILNKLHLVDRTQAAIYAWREGILPGTIKGEA